MLPPEASPQDFIHLQNKNIGLSIWEAMLFSSLLSLSLSRNENPHFLEMRLLGLELRNVGSGPAYR